MPQLVHRFGLTLVRAVRMVRRRQYRAAAVQSIGRGLQPSWKPLMSGRHRLFQALREDQIGGLQVGAHPCGLPRQPAAPPSSCAIMACPLRSGNTAPRQPRACPDPLGGCSRMPSWRPSLHGVDARPGRCRIRGPREGALDRQRGTEGGPKRRHAATAGGACEGPGRSCLARPSGCCRTPTVNCAPPMATSRAIHRRSNVISRRPSVVTGRGTCRDGFRSRDTELA
jgi:hypothetical protein